VVRAWQQPVDQVLAGGIGTLPLAPISDVAPEALPGVIRSMEDRLRTEATESDARTLWMSTYLLMGLRYSSEFASQLLRGVRDMEESTKYQAIIAKGEARGEARGKVAEARRMLLLFGGDKLGAPSESQAELIDSIHDVERLESLAKRIQRANSWDELLAS